MICPNCGEEMERGTISALGGGRWGYTYIHWLPKEVTMKKLFVPITKRGVNKCGGEVIKLYTMPEYTNTYICKKCRKLIMDY